MADRALVAVARVAKPHGVRGELRIHWRGLSPDVLDGRDTVFLGREGDSRPRPVLIEAWRPHGGAVLLKLSGIDDRNAADELRGLDILLAREDLPEPGEDEVLLHDILGFEVRLPDGRGLGVLEGFLETPATEVWTIRAPDGGEILFPAEPEFVSEVDMDRGVITVEPPPGLLDIYLNPEA